MTVASATTRATRYGSSVTTPHEAAAGNGLVLVVTYNQDRTVTTSGPSPAQTVTLNNGTKAYIEFRRITAAAAAGITSWTATASASVDHLGLTVVEFVGDVVDLVQAVQTDVSNGTGGTVSVTGLTDDDDVLYALSTQHNASAPVWTGVTDQRSAGLHATAWESPSTGGANASASWGGSGNGVLAGVGVATVNGVTVADNLFTTQAWNGTAWVTAVKRSWTGFDWHPPLEGGGGGGQPPAADDDSLIATSASNPHGSSIIIRDVHTSHLRAVVSGTASAVLLEWYGFVTSSTGHPSPASTEDNPLPNAITVEAAVSLNQTGAGQPVTWVEHVASSGVVTPLAGTGPARLDPGGRLRGRVNLAVADGDVLWVNTRHRPVGATTRIPLWDYSRGNVGEASQSNALSNLLAPANQWANNFSSAYGPLAIRGENPSPATLARLVVVGDSLATADYAIASTLRTGIRPYVQLARSGSQMATWLAGDDRSAQRRRVMDQGGYTAALVQFGTNDLSAGRTDTQIQTDLATVVAELHARGATTVAVCTIPPRTTSTDGWATLGNQALRPQDVASAEGYRQAVNAWLRSGTDNADGSYVAPAALTASGTCVVFDLAGPIEDLSGTFGRWAVLDGQPTTADGAHDTGAGTTARRSLLTTLLPTLDD